MATNEQVLKALDCVKDVGSGSSLRELGWLELMSLKSPKIVVRLTIPDFAQTQRELFANEIREVVKKNRRVR